MDAVEYLKTMKQMLDAERISGAAYRRMQLDMPEQAVKVVEEWAKKREEQS